MELGRRDYTGEKLSFRVEGKLRNPCKTKNPARLVVASRVLRNCCFGGTRGGCPFCSDVDGGMNCYHGSHTNLPGLEVYFLALRPAFQSGHPDTSQWVSTGRHRSSGRGPRLE